MGNEHFIAAGQDSPLHLQGFPQMVGFGKGVEQSIHGGGNMQDKRRGTFLIRWGIQGGIIQRDNSTEHCFVIGIKLQLNLPNSHGY